MSLSMRKKDWDQLFADHPELLEPPYPDWDGFWQYDPMRVALARSAALIRRDVTNPALAAFDVALKKMSTRD